MTVELLNEHHLEFLSLKGGCTGSSESTLVKMPHCWKSHVTAHNIVNRTLNATITDQSKAPRRRDTSTQSYKEKSFEPRHMTSNNVVF